MQDRDMLWQRLRTWLCEHAPLIIACSGGFDSRFLAHAAHQAGVSFVLVHFTGPHMAQAETTWVKAWASEQHYPLVTISVDPLVVEEVAHNATSRCYWCKRYLFLQLIAQKSFLAEQFFHGNTRVTVCDGSNASDAMLHRPGKKALEELGIASPLALCGLEKAVMRQLAYQIAMPMPQQHARPCLLTRIPYGQQLEYTVLRAIDAAEECMLRSLENIQGTKATVAENTAQISENYTSGGRGNFEAKRHTPEFRLRLFPCAESALGYRGDIHVDRKLPDEIEKQMQDCVVLAGFGRGSVVVKEVVSGFFDAQSTSQKE